MEVDSNKMNSASLTTETNDNHGNSKWKVNKAYLPLKLFYFFFYGASGAVIPFIGVYLKHLHLNASEAGVITGVAVLVAMSMRPLIGLAADRMNAGRSALSVCCFCFGIAFFFMWFLPTRPDFLQVSNNVFQEEVSNGTRTDMLETWKCFDTEHSIVCVYPESRNHTACSKAPSDTFHPGVLNLEEAALFRNFLVSSNGAPGKISLAMDKLKDNLSDSHLRTRSTYYKPCFYIASDNYSHQYHKNTNNSEKFYPDPSNASFSQSSEKNIVTCLMNCTKYVSLNDENISTETFITSHPLLETSTGAFYKRRKSSYQGTIILDRVFIISFLLIALARSFYASSSSLSDAMTYTVLGPKSLKWGQQRLWGTIGTAVSVMAITISNDRLHGENFAALFCACLGLSLLSSLVACLKLKSDKKSKSEDFWTNLITIFSQNKTRLFLGKLIFFGLLCGTANNFFLWYLVDLGSSQTTLGLVVLVHCLTSAITLRYAGLVLKRLGHTRTMHLVVVAYALRFLAFSLLTSPWLALPVELLHGLTYHMLWAAASSTASIVAPVGAQATCQGIAGAVYSDFGRGIGALVSGQILELITAPWTFRLYSALCVVALPLFLLLDRRWPLHHPQESQVVKVCLMEQGKDDAPLRSFLLKPEGPEISCKSVDANIEDSTIPASSLNMDIHKNRVNVIDEYNNDDKELFREIGENHCCPVIGSFEDSSEKMVQSPSKDSQLNLQDFLRNDVIQFLQCDNTVPAVNHDSYQNAGDAIENHTHCTCIHDKTQRNCNDRPILSRSFEANLAEQTNGNIATLRLDGNCEKGHSIEDKLNTEQSSGRDCSSITISSPTWENEIKIDDTPKRDTFNKIFCNSQILLRPVQGVDETHHKSISLDCVVDSKVLIIEINNLRPMSDSHIPKLSTSLTRLQD